MYFNKGQQDQLIHRYVYDADNRLLEVYTSRDGHLEALEATYIYYPHGPLAQVILGSYSVQTLDYYYTLEGWIKGVNLGLSEEEPDAFAYALGYHNNDYQPIASTIQSPLKTSSEHNLYNGNIAQMITQLPKTTGSITDSLPTNVLSVHYQYDQLNRIRNASQEQDGAGRKQMANYSYDANGNLMTLQRNTLEQAEMHDLSYDYYPNTNRLKRVTNSATGAPDSTNIFHSQADNNYIYDAIGNLIADRSEKVRIYWNIQGKVERSEHYAQVSDFLDTSGNFKTSPQDPQKTVKYRYDASGNRITKVVSTPEREINTLYVRDASGNIMGVYSDTLKTEGGQPVYVPLQLAEIPIYGSSRLGQYVPEDTLQTQLGLGHRRYELSNHLGNVLVTYSDAGHVLSYSDYYPFGLRITARSSGSEGYRYGFNGMEKNPSGELGSAQTYTTLFRQYNPVIGRWLSIDPVVHPWQSP
ncbi:RHS repeat domain-containing protein [Flammeovirga sp. EKP202]|uniref:RHS repeat domain-containing protein n=1 Tax=Flammeovirga sp. EKP202 TaxID=2770592 RepID=UPI00165F30C6|nr:RHS repeat protein [Flammeovirga sp. EKP202]MBD0401561.1 RHS repeat protein [Flammeovirga sp. EKP202]